MSTENGVDISIENKEQVSLQKLSELSGVPVGYIKSELLLDGDSVDMEKLRKQMLGALDSTFFKEA